MSISSGAKASKPLTGRRLALIIGGGFAVILTANITLAVFAVESWSGLLARNGYVASQDFNKLLAKARLQAARGWTAKLQVVGDNVRIEVSDASGAPVTGLQLRLHMGRPVHEKDDFEVLMVAEQGGYVAPATLAPGAWRAQVISVDDTIAYNAKFRVQVAAPAG